MINLHASGRARELIERAHPDAPDPLPLDVQTPAEVFRALTAQVPGFEKLMRESKWSLTVDDVAVLDIEQSKSTLPASAVLHLHPAAEGAGLFDFIGDLFEDVIGFVFDLVDDVLGIFGLDFAPDVPDYAGRDSAENQASYLFDGPVNTQTQGGVVPIVIGGPVRVGSVTISGGTVSSQIDDDAPPPRLEGPR